MDKILMIREVRNQTGCGLREAKDTVDEFLNSNGKLPGQVELMRIVALKVANRPKRSTELRQTIASVVKQMRDSLETLRDNTSEEWEDFDNARGLLRELPNQIDRIDRMVYRLEEIIAEQEK